MNRTVPSVAMIAMLACAPSCSLQAQQTQEEAPKARINITVTENGETKRLEREVPMNDPAAIENALREMGILDEMNIDNGANRIEINIKKRGDDGLLKDMDMSMFMDGPATVDVAPSVPRAFLGVYTGNWNESTCEDDKKKNKDKSSLKEGACITHVIEGSAAEKAGLKEGDVITAIDDKDVKSHAHLTEAVRSHKPGESVKVSYWRDGQKATTNATLGETQDEGYKYTYNHDFGDDGAPGAWTYAFSGGGSFLGVVPGGSENGRNGHAGRRHHQAIERQGDRRFRCLGRCRG
jgi:hypothetical protein